MSSRWEKLNNRPHAKRRTNLNALPRKYEFDVHLDREMKRDSSKVERILHDRLFEVLEYGDMAQWFADEVSPGLLTVNKQHYEPSYRNSRIDIQLRADGGGAIGIEVKAPAGTLRPNQLKRSGLYKDPLVVVSFGRDVNHLANKITATKQKPLWFWSFEVLAADISRAATQRRRRDKIPRNVLPSFELAVENFICGVDFFRGRNYSFSVSQTASAIEHLQSIITDRVDLHDVRASHTKSCTTTKSKFTMATQARNPFVWANLGGKRFGLWFHADDELLMAGTFEMFDRKRGTKGLTATERRALGAIETVVRRINKEIVGNPNLTDAYRSLAGQMWDAFDAGKGSKPETQLREMLKMSDEELARLQDAPEATSDTPLGGSMAMSA